MKRFIQGMHMIIKRTALIGALLLGIIGIASVRGLKNRITITANPLLNPALLSDVRIRAEYIAGALEEGITPQEIKINLQKALEKYILEDIEQQDASLADDITIYREVESHDLSGQTSEARDSVWRVKRLVDEYMHRINLDQEIGVQMGQRP